MPQLEALSIEIRACQAQSIFSDHPDLGVHHLTLLRDINVLINCGGARHEEVKVLETAISDATNLHPNHPKLCFHRDNQEGMVKDDAYVLMNEENTKQLERGIYMICFVFCFGGNRREEGRVLLIFLPIWV